MKITATRDAATAALKKLGVDKAQYNLYITKIGDKYHTDLAAATAVVNQLAAPAAEPVVKKLSKPQHRSRAPKAAATATMAKPPAVVKKVPSGSSSKPREASVAQAVYALLDQGLTNAEVWEVIKKEFNLDDKKRGYPAWYRAFRQRQAKK